MRGATLGASNLRTVVPDAGTGASTPISGASRRFFSPWRFPAGLQRMAQCAQKRACTLRWLQLKSELLPRTTNAIIQAQ